MRTFGIEIEMVGKSRPTIAKAIHDVVGGQEPIHVVDQEDENITYEKIYVSKDDYWKVEDDDSLRAPEELRAEAVSPPLTEADIMKLKLVVAAIAATGAQTNSYCGVHIHIGARYASVEDICRLIDVMIEEEPKLVKEFHCSPGRLRSFSKLMSPGFIGRFRKRRPRTHAELERLWYGKPVNPKSRSDRYHVSRYRGLNLQSYFCRGSVEFRYFDGSLDPDQIEAYVKRCIDIADKAEMP
ncbi:MAG: amidoligase family protein [Candidatus Aureabacteria bacterium]|nr:amidoligase family protein [Candidatus Auribacterota bacterium]